MTRVPFALFNVGNGAVRDEHGGHRFQLLQRAAADLDEVPALWLICEAKRWRRDANTGLYGAAEALADELGVPYTPALGTSLRGSIAPAILWNPNVITMKSWWGPGDPDPDAYDDQINTAEFAVNDSGTTSESRNKFIAWVDHFHPGNAASRLLEADRRTRYGRKCRLPAIGGADTNENASGPHFPQRDWTIADDERRAAEARQLPDGTWVTETGAMDLLIGRWDPERQCRQGGSGHLAIAERAWQAGVPHAMTPTVRDKPSSGGQIIKDYLFDNPAMAPHIDPDSYRVYQSPKEFDHNLVKATFNLSRRYPHAPATSTEHPHDHAESAVRKPPHA